MKQIMNILKYRKLALAVMLFCCFLTFSCVSVTPVYYENDKKVAEKFVERFHQLLNEENYDEIYKMFSQKMQTAQSREQFDRALKNILAANGKVKSSKIVKSDVKPQASFRVVHMVYETQFEKLNQLEEFDCLVDGETAVFDFYGHPTQMPNNP